jgi:hypothetical protein
VENITKGKYDKDIFIHSIYYTSSMRLSERQLCCLTMKVVYSICMRIKFYVGEIATENTLHIMLVLISWNWLDALVWSVR